MAQQLTVLSLNRQSSIFLPKLLLFVPNSLTGSINALLHPVEYSRRHRIYPPTQYSEPTHPSVIAACQIAEAEGDAVCAIQGISPWYKSLDLVDAAPVDYMHAVMEGVAPSLCKHWFLPKYHFGAYIGSKLKTVDTLLLRQQPPHELNHPPCVNLNILKHRSFVHGFSSTLFPYYLTVFPLYLVCATHILLQDNITLAQVQAAESVLGEFCKLLTELYVDQICTSNAHLSQLPKNVRLWGPLWTHSVFGFENKNGQLKRLLHGCGNSPTAYVQ